MGIGDDGDTTAASRLRTLHRHFRQHPVTGPEGNSYVSSAPRPTSTTPAIPYDVEVAEHIRESVSEVVANVLAINPHASPLPANVEAVYAWYLENTKDAEPAQQERREAIIYRQSLEHAIAMGDQLVVRKHRCPRCRTLGLMWKGSLQRALCTNMRCVTKDGVSSTWTLARLAYEHVAVEKTLAVRAT